jgi:hypothetical protein
MTQFRDPVHCWCGMDGCLSAPLPFTFRKRALGKTLVAAKPICPTCRRFYCNCLDLNAQGSSKPFCDICGNEARFYHLGCPFIMPSVPILAPKPMKEQVFDYIVSCGYRGATDEDVQVALDINPSSERPRRQELAKAGRIKSAGTRKTQSGRDALVWYVPV